MESDLGAISRDLIVDLERLRPGFGAEATSTEVETLVRKRALVRLGEVFRDRHDEDEGGALLALYQREVEQILVPRYAALARRENLAARRVRSFSDGDLANRAAYGLLFGIIGLGVLWAPFIPLWEKWIPFALGGAASLFAPVLPDLAGSLRRRRHRFALLNLLIDVDEAGKALPINLPVPQLPAASAEDASRGGALK